MPFATSGQWLRMRQMCTHVPDQTVLSRALGTGQEKVPVVLQAVPTCQQSGEPRARTHRHQTICVWILQQVVRTIGQLAHTRPHSLGSHAVRVRHMSPSIHTNRQFDRAQTHAQHRQAVRMRLVSGVVLPTIPAGQAPEKAPISKISSSTKQVNARPVSIYYYYFKNV